MAIVAIPNAALASACPAFSFRLSRLSGVDPGYSSQKRRRLCHCFQFLFWGYVFSNQPFDVLSFAKCFVLQGFHFQVLFFRNVSQLVRPFVLPRRFHFLDKARSAAPQTQRDRRRPTTNTRRRRPYSLRPKRIGNYFEIFVLAFPNYFCIKESKETNVWFFEGRIPKADAWRVILAIPTPTATWKNVTFQNVLTNQIQIGM